MDPNVEMDRSAFAGVPIGSDDIDTPLVDLVQVPSGVQSFDEPASLLQERPAPSSVPVASQAPPSAAPGESSLHSKLNRIQLIDETQHFHESAFAKQLKDWGLEDAGFGYDICAVLGSQSTGKSTLLNKLFGTSFDVMNERKRQQTTKGIWLSRGMERNVLVMDVEGTDGRERGEDQDFERKSSLFALTTAECLIVNMWENQVGLYQGANMGLLKTVLDVNLSLFQSGRAKSGAPKEKTVLMFVVRDYIGTTPMANLEETIRGDLQRIWASLRKPENLIDALLTDFFDFMFLALPHKILMPLEFDQAVDAMRTRFLERDDPDYVFQTQYHKRIPIDGLPHYLQGVWDQIVQNKDLDLPTQQELLAQFRCDEIAALASAAFVAAVAYLRNALDGGKVLPMLGEQMNKHRTAALMAFDKDASRYHASVYAKKRAELTKGLNATLLPYFLTQLKNLDAMLTSSFRAHILDRIRTQPSSIFGDVVREEHALALAAFDAMTEQMILSDTDWSVAEERAALDESICSMAVTLRAEQSKKMAVQLEREVRRRIAEPVALAMAQPGAAMWDAVLNAYSRIMEDATLQYKHRAVMLSCTPQEEAVGLHALYRTGWRSLLQKVHEQTAEPVLSVRLRNAFEEKFRYDAEGVPRVWKPNDDMDTAFTQARDATLKLIPLYARIRPSDEAMLQAVRDSEQEPSFRAAVDAGDEEPLDLDDALQVLTELQSAEMGVRLRKDADAYYVEAKRSTVSSMAQVPLWMYAVLVMLGWNEAMAVLRSPVYFTLLCMLIAGAYVVWRLNLGGPLFTVTTSVAREMQKVVEDKLREYLVPPAPLPPAMRQEERPVESEDALKRQDSVE
ncbi:Dynamin-like GTPase that mediates homotypic ER fusion [Malassezia vespertilionis]|uniref:Sey1p n=1 Tax=Malassezia vespertilionis TaxID=2020962 RepID=A0A2N1JER5_9BASI|nr:Dynamin-like GTPase that mediates homotypic ER fusion [Malassezia vespertilionis]PKI85029.1 Sey1p [Malassezia vespertilionis]WFD06085.1 Dynamin-like GTPase that mediates homotypic ER fusion [Malassezia vespertilionis]